MHDIKSISYSARALGSRIIKISIFFDKEKGLLNRISIFLIHKRVIKLTLIEIVI